MGETAHERHRLAGRALIVAGWFPPRPGGSAVILANLLRWIDPADVVVATGVPPAGEPGIREIDGVRRHFVSRNRRAMVRGQQLWNTLQIPLAVVRVVALARRERCRVIVGVFPDLQLMAVAYLAHRVSGLPLVAYLHDFMIEARYGSYLGALARWLQPRVFRRARPLWTMSRAMTEHVEHTYGVRSAPLVHAYNEPLPAQADTARAPAAGRLRLFFSGAVYAANAASMARVIRAIAAEPQSRLTIAGHCGPEVLEAQGVSAGQIDQLFLGDRQALLELMQKQDVLVAGLSWPDESSYGEHELATIFSTKLPEYFAQGKPILVHCPEHYFIARFCREHDCAWVVAERSEAAIQAALHEIAADAQLRERRCRNALETAREFAGDRVARRFVDGIGAALDPSGAPRA